jgi:hypothetical protein
MTYLPQRISIKVGVIEWRAHRLGDGVGRYVVDITPLLLANEARKSAQYRDSAKQIVAAVQALENISDWLSFRNRDLIGCLMNDIEEAHAFVALNMPNIDSYLKGQVISKHSVSPFTHLFHLSCTHPST